MRRNVVVAGLVTGAFVSGLAHNTYAVPPRPASEIWCELSKRVARRETTAPLGFVHIATSPAFTTVYVDDKPFDVSWSVKLRLPPGTHWLQIGADGFVTRYMEIGVRDGSTLDIAIKLERASHENDAIGSGNDDGGEICDIDPNAPGCGVAQIKMTEEAKKALKEVPAFGDYFPPRLGTTPAKAMGLAALTSAAAGTVLGLLALRDRGSSANPMSPQAEEGQALTTIADASFLAAAAFVLAGVVLYLQRDEPQHPYEGGPRATWGGAHSLLDF